MHSKNAQQENHTALPKLVGWLLSRLANPAYKNELIGDLEEEYIERQSAHQETTKWLCSQAMFAIWDGQKAMARTTKFVKVISIILCILALPTIVFFVGWLANMQDPSEQLWQLLVDGKIHAILFNSEYWQSAWNEHGLGQIGLATFINVPGIFWALLFAGASYLFLSKTNSNSWQYGIFALAFIVVPYLLGYAAISALEPEPQKIGPTIAFMVLAPFFTIPVYLVILFGRFRK
ncbi:MULTISPECIES: hypothetical protein [Gammaproteobacteria]|uniref:hypothetical protein n=1 Tax=Gammaproteobacteria TaxID=1236 RepID=UPI000DCF8203|nr:MULTISPECIES: hypothetical protein [Gammaproteobacteria]RTE85496.1 hypothetical protein DQX04_11375 [Aliidiomarina sp. B3213]TCZ89465.1 hypothetical protein EYQ95_11300 [Lysobacter sp. N42]